MKKQFAVLESVTTKEIIFVKRKKILTNDTELVYGQTYDVNYKSESCVCALKLAG